VTFETLTIKFGLVLRVLAMGLRCKKHSYSLHFEARHLLIGVTMIVAISPTCVGVDAIPGPISTVEGHGSQPGAFVWKDWIPFASGIGTAVVAGWFALRQQRRALTAQRELEAERVESTRREAEIAEERATTSRFRQTQVLPFLEKLDESLTKSFAVVQIPEFFSELIPYAPPLRHHIDETVSEWLTAMEMMSEHRMQLLLATDPDRIQTVVSLLTQLVDQTQQILTTRNQFWYKQATSTDLRAVQQEYVRTGYRLMMEIKEAVTTPYHPYTVLSDGDKNNIAQELAIPFEKGGVVSVPYGGVTDFSWVALWQIDTRPAWQKFEQALNNCTLDEFEAALRGIAERLVQNKEVLDSQLFGFEPSDDLAIHCLSAKLPSAERLHRFKEVDLPGYRCEFKMLWSSHRAPIEFTTGLGEGDKAREGMSKREALPPDNSSP
jgi:hypothetical protein